MEDIDKRIDEVNAKLLEGADTTEQLVETEVSAPVDMYQGRRKNIQEANMPRSRGAEARLGVDLSILEQGDLGYAFKRAKDEGDGAEREGDRERARLIRESYMQDTWLPTLDALVGLNGAEAILASQKTLDLLDNYALVEGGGSRGYTQAMVSSLYDLTEPQNSPSDAYVRYNIGKLSSLCGDGQIRAAVGLATQLKNSIDRGEHLASPEDYESLQKVIFKSY